MKFKGVLVVGLPILRNPFAEVSHRALYVLDGAEGTSVVVVELVLRHEIGCRCLCHVHFLVQMFDLGGAVPYGFVKEGSIGRNIAIRGKVATKW